MLRFDMPTFVRLMTPKECSRYMRLIDVINVRRVILIKFSKIVVTIYGQQA